MNRPMTLLMIARLCIASAAASVGQALAQDWESYPVPASPGPGQLSALDPSLSDDFNYETGDPSGRAEFDRRWNDWKPDHWFGPGATHFSEENYVVSGGMLTIRASRIPVEDQTPSDDAGFTRTVYTSYITSEAMLRPGCYTEVMMKGTGTTLSSNFWMIDDRNQTEIDVVEIYGDGDWFPRRPASAVHFQRRGGSGDVFKQLHHPKGNIVYAAGFHRYGVHWISETELRFYYDGEPVRTLDLTEEIPDPSGRYLDQPVRLILDLEAHAWRGTDKVPGVADLDDDSGNAMHVDWVRTYRLAEQDDPPGRG